MPSPLLFSFTTIIGRSVININGAFDFNLSRPRHSARKPPIELAPPTSTPNSVRRTASLAAADGSSGCAAAADATAATPSGIGAAVTVFAGASGSISFAAGVSGGASIDFDAISGGGVAGGAFVVAWATHARGAAG